MPRGYLRLNAVRRGLIVPAMQSEKTLIDDLARLATGAAGMLGDMKTEVETRVREQIERIVARMNLPTREELDAVKALAAAARAEADVLAKRVAELEAAAAPRVRPAAPANPARRTRKPRA